MTTPLHSLTPISYERRQFPQSESVYGRFWPFFFAYALAQIRHYLCFRAEIFITVVLSESICYKGMENFAISQRLGKCLAIFYCACAESAISELPATIITTPLDSATPISYKRRIFRQSEYIFYAFLHFLSRNPPYFYFRSAWPNFLKSGTRGAGALVKWIPSTKFEVDPTICYRDMTPLPPIRYVTLWPSRLIFWPWTVLGNVLSCGLTLHQMWAS